MDALDSLCGATHVEDETDVDELISDLEETLKSRVDGNDAVHVEVEIADLDIPQELKEAMGMVQDSEMGTQIGFGQ